MMGLLSANPKSGDTHVAPCPPAVAALTRSATGRFGGWVLWVVGMVALAIAQWHHEPWRDEVQAWGLVKDAVNPLNFPSTLLYEGHPWLWHTFLWPFTWVSGSPVMLQLATWTVGAASLWLIAVRMPVALIWRVLLVPGYFVFFEYGVLARSYALGQLLVLVTAWVISRQGSWTQGRTAGVSALVFLTCQTSLFGGFLAIGLAALVLTRRRATWLQRIAVAGALVVGIWIAWLQARPPPDSNEWRGAEPFELGNWVFGAGRTLVQALLPLTPWSDSGWWTRNGILDDLPIQTATAFGVVALILAVIALRGINPRVLFLTTTIFVVAFANYSARGMQTYHFGAIWVAFLAALWISEADRRRLCSGAHDAEPAGVVTWFRLQRAALFALVAAQAVGGITIAIRDFKEPFSPAGNAAQLVRTVMRPGGTVIAGRTDSVGQSVCAWLDNPCIIFEGQRAEWSVKWSPSRRVLPRSPITWALKKIAANPNGGVIVTSMPIKDRRLRLVRFFPDTGLGMDENVFVWLPRSPAGTPEGKTR